MRQPTGSAVYGALALAIVLIISMSAGPAAARLGTTRGAPDLPCTSVGLNPPGVNVGECTNTMNGVGTSAERQDLDVIVEWSVLDPEIEIDQVRLFRGVSTDEMHPIAVQGPDAERYIDPAALLTGDALYYQTVILTTDAEIVEGPIVQVQFLGGL